MIGLSLFLSIDIFDPLNSSDNAFLHLVSSLDYLENSNGNSDLITAAYEQLLKAIRDLESMKLGDASYYSNTKQEEKTLIKNLKNRLAPAILAGNVTHVNLQEIAQIFTNSDTDFMKIINEQLEQQFETREIGDTFGRSISSSFKESPIVNFLNIITKTTFGLLVLSLVGGFTLLFAGLLLLSQITNYIFFGNLLTILD